MMLQMLMAGASLVLLILVMIILARQYQQCWQMHQQALLALVDMLSFFVLLYVQPRSYGHFTSPIPSMSPCCIFIKTNPSLNIPHASPYDEHQPTYEIPRGFSVTGRGENDYVCLCTAPVARFR